MNVLDIAALVCIYVNVHATAAPVRVHERACYTSFCVTNCVTVNVLAIASLVTSLVFVYVNVLAI